MDELRRPSSHRSSRGPMPTPSEPCVDEPPLIDVPPHGSLDVPQYGPSSHQPRDDDPPHVDKPPRVDGPSLHRPAPREPSSQRPAPMPIEPRVDVDTVVERTLF
eukprot:TRINITY_DN1541_c0_g1_i2.p7 TRINITY_DN1541_c0_g1~~TRINITY_DN1541_c0_g1_i2.p7  ORF type:complete len:104 (+),score=22.01 TRINITY_DN1541_c0_g1_i2:1195-1506(+)